jgi:ferrous iron transport protein B
MTPFNKQEIAVALVGNPNSGKTSLFNALTGLNQKVSNFPGTTVEKKIGQCKLSNTTSAQIIDLPGTYSLYPKSADELVTYEILRNKAETDFPDIVLFIADASNLKRNLLLLTQVADLGVPVILALNMTDIAERRGIFYDISILSEKLKIPVVPINARTRKGIHEIKAHLLNVSNYKRVNYFSLNQAAEDALLDELCDITDKRNTYAAIQYSINAAELLNTKSKQIRDCFEKHAFDARKFQEHEILSRYRIIDEAVRESRHTKTSLITHSFSQKVDKVLTHRIWGIAIFIMLLFMVFQAIFSWSSIPMQWFENGFTLASQMVEASLPDGVLRDLIISGILAGLSGVMVFLPQIIILFAFIAILEDVGYMARVGFIMDRLMRPFGMNGKSVVPLISGMACAVPSIMASRNIENKKERLITILVTPLMSCSARLPVYTLLISLLVPVTAKWGPFNLHGIVLMAMYLLGFIAVLFSAFVFKFFIKNPVRNYFMMELPGYKLPVWSNILITLYDKGKAFVWGAGKIIVAVSVVLWALASFGPSQHMQQVDAKYDTLIVKDSTDAERIHSLRAAEKLQASYAGEFGRWIEPAIKPLGFDWKIGVALLTSLAAREVFVGTMSTIYSVGGEIEDLSSIREKMLEEKNQDGSHKYSLATVLSLMIFYAFALQCMSTVSIVREETQSIKWPVIQFVYMTALAYISSLVVYTIFS